MSNEGKNQDENVENVDGKEVKEDENAVSSSGYGTHKSDVVSPYGDPWQNDEYYYQYGKLSIHHEMIKDKHRTDSYRRAILSHSDDFKDKVVLDVGSGTGILSFFAVEAGASFVYAVEASNLADWTEMVVAANGLSDKIHVVKGKLEELQFPVKVDIIISEWMGSFLIFESMLETILWARDNVLKGFGDNQKPFDSPSLGTLFPSHASMHLAPVEADQMDKEKIEFWRDVYGTDMTPFIPFARKCAFEKPMIDVTVEPTQLLSDACCLCHWDLHTLPISQPYAKTIHSFKFTVNPPGRKTKTKPEECPDSGETGEGDDLVIPKKSEEESVYNLHGLVGWFDVEFNGPPSGCKCKEKLREQREEEKNAKEKEPEENASKEEECKKSEDDETNEGENKDLLNEDQEIMLRLSTSPFHTPTHWRQLLLLFDESFPVKKGEVITGQIRIQRNPELLRHLIIDVGCSSSTHSRHKQFFLWGTE